MSVREFEKLLIKCDIQEPEEQTIVRYLGGLEPKYANIVELQQYSTFNEVCVLAHKVEQQKKKNPFRKEPPRNLPKNPSYGKAVASPYRRTAGACARAANRASQAAAPNSFPKHISTSKSLSTPKSNCPRTL